MTKTKSEIEYLNRVKKYIDLSNIKSKSDLEVQLHKGGLLGKNKQFKQLNIIVDELGFETIEKTEHIWITDKTAKQTITRYNNPVIVYRDKKGRFTKYVG